MTNQQINNILNNQNGIFAVAYDNISQADFELLDFPLNSTVFYKGIQVIVIKKQYYPKASYGLIRLRIIGHLENNIIKFNT